MSSVFQDIYDQCLQYSRTYLINVFSIPGHVWFMHMLTKMALNYSHRDDDRFSVNADKYKFSCILVAILDFDLTELTNIFGRVTPTHFLVRAWDIETSI